MSDESEHLIEQDEALTMSMFLHKRDMEEARRQQSLERQVIHLAAKNAELLMALEEIAKKRKLDAVAASSMKSIAVAALAAAGIKAR